MTASFGFAPNSIVRPHPEQLTAQIDHQVVVMGIVEGKYVGFNDIASTIWWRIEKAPTISQLCQDMIADYQGDPIQIEKDVLSLIAKLHDLSLVVIETESL